MLRVVYSGQDVSEGQVLNTAQTQSAPQVGWTGSPSQLHTLSIYDLDVGYLHFLEVNIPGSEVLQGEVLSNTFLPILLRELTPIKFPFTLNLKLFRNLPFKIQVTLI